MKVAVINGSPRKNGNGSKFLKEIIALLETEVEVEVRLINLCENNIGMCRGCQLCYQKGEDFCPIKDDVNSIRNELLECEGIVFYSPTYIVNMSGLMKNFFDRLSYICHRPEFYRKSALVITTTGGSGGASALKCIKWPVIAWGLSIVKSFDIKMSQYNHSDRYKLMVDENIKKLTRLFIEEVKAAKASSPGLIDLTGFNARKQNYLKSSSVHKYDVEYWRKNGWLDKDTFYYFPVRVGSLKKLLVGIFTKILKVVM